MEGEDQMETSTGTLFNTTKCNISFLQVTFTAGLVVESGSISTDVEQFHASDDILQSQVSTQSEFKAPYDGIYRIKFRASAKDHSPKYKRSIKVVKNGGTSLLSLTESGQVTKVLPLERGDTCSMVGYCEGQHSGSHYNRRYYNCPDYYYRSVSMSINFFGPP